MMMRCLNLSDALVFGALIVVESVLAKQDGYTFGLAAKLFSVDRVRRSTTEYSRFKCVLVTLAATCTSSTIKDCRTESVSVSQILWWGW